ncbi:hypothetical protein E8E13_000134 [Curvularia kusanoi]|uniref:Uncharacterized protein n=1 Tax=Curvularia kusanoi TaxID=90978 RepID=A0A9P4W8J2_CURKU|nr:hypothetical protein E8E13_000134 [Curvularia kusanoi]
MDERYAYLGVHGGHHGRRNPSLAVSTTNQNPCSQRMTLHHAYAHMSPAPYPLAMASANEALEYTSSARSCDTSLHQASLCFAGADPGPVQDQRQRIRLRSETDSEQVAWQFHGQNFPATPSTSYSGSQLAAQGLPPCPMIGPIRDHSPSPLPSANAQFEALNLYSDERALSSEWPGDRSNSSWVSGSPVVNFPQIQQSQAEAAPWSSINPRSGFFESGHANQGLEIIPGLTNDSYPELSDAFSGGHENLVEYQDMSAASFDSDINGIMENLSMMPEPSSDNQPPHDAGDVVPSNGVPFWRVDRVGTPCEAAASAQDVQMGNSVV